MKIVRPEYWEPSDNLELEEAANHAIRYDSHILVEAGPGAGKTELLAQKASFLFQTNLCKEPRRILAISFKTDAAHNLKERIERRCGKDVGDRFASLTYDAFAKSILDHFRCALPVLICPQRDYVVNDFEIIDAAFRKAGLNNPDGLSKTKLFFEYDRILSSAEISNNSNELGSVVWHYLVKGFDGNKSTLSFKMITILADYIIRNNPKIKKAIQLTYSHVFLDEFQDTTNMQYNLVKCCFEKSPTTITAVGDNKQRIMLWAGAMPNIFSVFLRDWKSEKVHLIMNHRSAPRLVELQKSMYMSLKETNIGAVCPNKWNENDGEISLFITTDEENEAIKITHNIINKINNGVRPCDICILCKQLPDSYSNVIIDKLRNNGIRARIETIYQDLIKEPVISLTIDILSCALNRKQPQKWERIESIIMELWNVELLCQNSSFEIYRTKFFEGMDSIGRQLAKSNADNLSSIINTIWDFLDEKRIRSYYPTYRTGEYLSELKAKFEILLAKELEYSDNKWDVAIDNFLGLNSIPIMTIHKSKGLEYDAVYFLGLEDSAFWNFRKQSEEDRCAFFVALSRAKRSVAFTFCKYRSRKRFPVQSHNDINEFYDLLQKPGMAIIYES